MDCQKNTNNIIKMTDKKAKPKYVKKKISYCLKCGRKTKNKNIEGVTLQNKIGQQKSTCVVCDFKKSTKTNKTQ